MAYCQRDTALYLSMLVGGLLYARQRLWTRGLPWWAYALLALPIAVDGGTALFGLRESTPFLRTLTGGLFGWMTAWYLFPMIEATMSETRRILQRKFAVVAQTEGQHREK